MDYNSMKVAELRSELTKRGLPGAGLKAELVQRLIEDDNGGGKKEEPEAEEEPTTTKRSTRSKATKAEPEPEAPPAPKRTRSQAIAELKAEDSKSKKSKGGAVFRKKDPNCYQSGDVFEDYDCMLNQTNIGQNNNKFYVIQVIVNGSSYYCYNRWGRVGERGQDSIKGPFNKDKAIKDFESKFKDKTKNSWGDRDNFEAYPGKYTLIEIDHDADAEQNEKLSKLDGSAPEKPKKKKEYKESTLPKPTQELIKLIFDEDMFKMAMESFDIDVKKMPLGAISKAQIAKGYEVLVELEDELKKARPSNAKINEISSKFYTLIPHSFGRRIPPPINNTEMLQKKMDMLNVLGDIEIAQGLQDNKDSKEDENDEGLLENPYDKNYKTLKADLTPVDPNSEIYKIIDKYTRETMSQFRKVSIIDAFEINRHDEGKRFGKHEELENRKLLWHGTNVAVVAAICASGLRIMPHSGGRVGKGIYLASENGKSAGYVGTSGNTGIMFLAEAALGKEHHITKDDPSLVAPPKGYDSIVAQGQTDPDPKKNIQIEIEGHQVTVPQGKPIERPEYKSSYFSQSEYLVYQESQVRLRYLLKCRF